MTDLDKTKEREAFHEMFDFSYEAGDDTREKEINYWLERMALHEQKVREEDKKWGMHMLNLFKTLLTV
jgi:hypothetical protein